MPQPMDVAAGDYEAGPAVESATAGGVGGAAATTDAMDTDDTAADAKPASTAPETPAQPTLFEVGQIVEVQEYRKPSKDGKALGAKLKGGVARVTARHEDDEDGTTIYTYDLNFYLESRRTRRAPAFAISPSLMDQASKGSDAVGSSGDGEVAGAGAGGRRERKKATSYVPESATTTAGPGDKDAVQSNGDSAEGGGEGGAGTSGKAKGGGAAVKKVVTKPAVTARDDNADLKQPGHRLVAATADDRNHGAYKQGHWRREPYGHRCYENISHNGVGGYQLAPSISDEITLSPAKPPRGGLADRADRRTRDPLRTTLTDNCVIGLPYNDEVLVQDYIGEKIIDFKWQAEEPAPGSGSAADSNGLPKAKANHTLKQSRDVLREWFKTDAKPKEEAEAEAEDGDDNPTDEKTLEEAVEEALIRSQVASRLDGMVNEVGIRACDEAKTLLQTPKTLAENCLNEQPVWGLDAYTRFNIRLILEDSPSYQALCTGLNGSLGPTKPKPTAGEGDEKKQCEAKEAGGMEVDGEGSEDGKEDEKEDGKEKEKEKEKEKPAIPHAYTKEDATVTNFIEHTLLPAINSQPTDKASDMVAALDAIIKANGGDPVAVKLEPPKPKMTSKQAKQKAKADRRKAKKEKEAAEAAAAEAGEEGVGGTGNEKDDGSGEEKKDADETEGEGDDPMDVSSASADAKSSTSTTLLSALHLEAAKLIKLKILTHGRENYRIHPKGTGVVVINPKGLPANELVDNYLGEIYPPWRWLERQDAVASAQRALETTTALPDFYNIALERPSTDPQGYGLWYVDASSRGNMASSLSHSCRPNCEPRMAVKNGKLTIVLITLREVALGEELTFDYGAVTTSETEYRMAVCLCGTANCRQSFLHFVAANNTQRLLNRWHSATHRFAYLFDACCKKATPGDRIATKTTATLTKHGLGAAAGLGDDEAPFWLRHFSATVLDDFVIRERTMLPISLIMKGGFGDYVSANQEARSLIEQRMQSLVCSVSCVHHYLKNQGQKDKAAARQSRLKAGLADAAQQQRPKPIFQQQLSWAAPEDADTKGKGKGKGGQGHGQSHGNGLSGGGGGGGGLGMSMSMMPLSPGNETPNGPGSMSMSMVPVGGADGNSGGGVGSSSMAMSMVPRGDMGGAVLPPPPSPTYLMRMSTVAEELKGNGASSSSLAGSGSNGKSSSGGASRWGQAAKALSLPPSLPSTSPPSSFHRPSPGGKSKFDDVAAATSSNATRPASSSPAQPHDGLPPNGSSASAGGASETRPDEHRPPLVAVREDEVVDRLWRRPKSMVQALLRAVEVEETRKPEGLEKSNGAGAGAEKEGKGIGGANGTTSIGESGGGAVASAGTSALDALASASASASAADVAMDALASVASQEAEKKDGLEKGGEKGAGMKKGRASDTDSRKSNGKAKGGTKKEEKEEWKISGRLKYLIEKLSSVHHQPTKKGEEGGSKVEDSPDGEAGSEVDADGEMVESGETATEAAKDAMEVDEGVKENDEGSDAMVVVKAEDPKDEAVEEPSPPPTPPSPPLTQSPPVSFTGAFEPAIAAAEGELTFPPDYATLYPNHNLVNSHPRASYAIGSSKDEGKKEPPTPVRQRMSRAEKEFIDMGVEMGWNDAEGLERVDSLETCRAALLAVRKLLLIPALHPSVPVASRQRHHAAADAVLLLAHTSTFAVAQAYEAVESTAIPVYARELGAPLTRSGFAASQERLQNLTAQQQEQQKAIEAQQEKQEKAAKAKREKEAKLIIKATQKAADRAATKAQAAAAKPKPEGGSRKRKTNATGHSDIIQAQRQRKKPPKDGEPAMTAAQQAAAAGLDPRVTVDLSDVPTNLEPMVRQRATGPSTSQYRGVCRSKRSGCDRWQAQISHGGTNYYLGLFDSERQAAVAYARAYYKFCGPGRPQDEHTNLSSNDNTHALHALQSTNAHASPIAMGVGSMSNSLPPPPPPPPADGSHDMPLPGVGAGGESSLGFGSPRGSPPPPPPPYENTGTPGSGDEVRKKKKKKKSNAKKSNSTNKDAGASAAAMRGRKPNPSPEAVRARAAALLASARNHLHDGVAGLGPLGRRDFANAPPGSSLQRIGLGMAASMGMGMGVGGVGSGAIGVGGAYGVGNGLRGIPGLNIGVGGVANRGSQSLTDPAYMQALLLEQQQSMASGVLPPYIGGVGGPHSPNFMNQLMTQQMAAARAAASGARNSHPSPQAAQQAAQKALGLNGEGSTPTSEGLPFPKGHAGHASQAHPGFVYPHHPSYAPVPHPTSSGSPVSRAAAAPAPAATATEMDVDGKSENTPTTSARSAGATAGAAAGVVSSAALSSSTSAASLFGGSGSAVASTKAGASCPAKDGEASTSKEGGEGGAGKGGAMEVSTSPSDTTGGDDGLAGLTQQQRTEFLMQQQMLAQMPAYAQLAQLQLTQQQQAELLVQQQMIAEMQQEEDRRAKEAGEDEDDEAEDEEEDEESDEEEETDEEEEEREESSVHGAGVGADAATAVGAGSAAAAAAGVVSEENDDSTKPRRNYSKPRRPSSKGTGDGVVRMLVASGSPRKRSASTMSAADKKAVAAAKAAKAAKEKAEEAEAAARLAAEVAAKATAAVTAGGRAGAGAVGQAPDASSNSPPAKRSKVADSKTGASDSAVDDLPPPPPPPGPPPPPRTDGFDDIPRPPSGPPPPLLNAKGTTAAAKSGAAADVDDLPPPPPPVSEQPPPPLPASAPDKASPVEALPTPATNEDEESLPPKKRARKLQQQQLKFKPAAVSTSAPAADSIAAPALASVTAPVSAPAQAPTSAPASAVARAVPAEATSMAIDEAPESNSVKTNTGSDTSGGISSASTSSASTIVNLTKTKPKADPSAEMSSSSSARAEDSASPSPGAVGTPATDSKAGASGSSKPAAGKKPPAAKKAGAAALTGKGKGGRASGAVCGTKTAAGSSKAAAAATATAAKAIVPARPKAKPKPKPKDNRPLTESEVAQERAMNAEADAKAAQQSLDRTYDLVRKGVVDLVPGDELVHTYRARYGPYFILGRLLDWFNVEEGGALADLTQSGLSLPNELLIGCVLMPEPAACYDAKAPYTQDERLALHTHLSDRRTKYQPWPEHIMAAFGGARPRQRKFRESKLPPLLGSPLVDEIQGSYMGLFNVMRTLKSELNIDGTSDDPRMAGLQGAKKRGANGKFGTQEKSLAVEEDMIDQAMEDKKNNWVQCEQCEKWRRVPWFVDDEELEQCDEFVCTDSNKWYSDRGSGHKGKIFTCDTPEDDFDPMSEYVDSTKGDVITEWKVGMQLDGWCLANKRWYEAKVIAIKEDSIKIHFKGWNPKADEWIAKDSDRVKPHRFFTSGDWRKTSKVYVGDEMMEATGGGTTKKRGGGKPKGGAKAGQGVKGKNGAVKGGGSAAKKSVGGAAGGGKGKGKSVGAAAAAGGESADGAGAGAGTSTSDDDIDKLVSEKMAELAAKVKAVAGFGAWQPDGWTASIKGDKKNRRYNFVPPSGKPQFRSLRAAELHITKHAPDASL